jgi:hypothetical protein
MEPILWLCAGLISLVMFVLFWYYLSEIHRRARQCAESLQWIAERILEFQAERAGSKEAR